MKTLNGEKGKDQLSKLNKKTGKKTFEALLPYVQNTNIVKWNRDSYAFIVDWQISEKEG